VTLLHGPRSVVVDASVAVDFLKGDVTWTDRWTAWVEEGAMILAPLHAPAEVGNSLLRSVRLPRSEVALAIGRLWRSGIETADRGLPGLLEALDLADRHGLTVYDALYLQLALDVEAELATMDDDLRRAAAAEGVATVEA
jgi:predicted nucleic acid-binding protein